MKKGSFWAGLGAVVIGLLAACIASPSPVVPVGQPTPAPRASATIVVTASPTLQSDAVADQAVFPAVVREAAVTEIPLSGPVAKRDAEISGLAWYGDYLVLLPQYPGRFGDHLFALAKQDIIDFLDGALSGPLSPQPIPLIAPALTRIDGYEGLEAIAFLGDRAFVTIETSPGPGMMGYLVGGRIAPDLSEIRLDTEHLVPIEPQARISNFSDEAILAWDDVIATLYEANGANVNPAPVAHRFDLDLTPLGEIPFPNIEYRITDATALDDDGYFWAINYLFPGEIAKLDPAPDPLVAAYGVGATHAAGPVVERLVKFQYTAAGIKLAAVQPVQLHLLADGEARNWEGIARLDERGGFLLATDKFPTTILAFVEIPEN